MKIDITVNELKKLIEGDLKVNIVLNHKDFVSFGQATLNDNRKEKKKRGRGRPRKYLP